MGSTVVRVRTDGARLPFLAMRNGVDFAKRWEDPNLQRFLDLLLFKSPGPCLGEDNEYVCKRILGFSDKEYDDLMAERVLR